MRLTIFLLLLFIMNIQISAQEADTAKVFNSLLQKITDDSLKGLLNIDEIITSSKEACELDKSIRTYVNQNSIKLSKLNDEYNIQKGIENKLINVIEVDGYIESVIDDYKILFSQGNRYALKTQLKKNQNFKGNIIKDSDSVNYQNPNGTFNSVNIYKISAAKRSDLKDVQKKLNSIKTNFNNEVNSFLSGLKIIVKEKLKIINNQYTALQLQEGFNHLNNKNYSDALIRFNNVKCNEYNIENVDHYIAECKQQIEFNEVLKNEDNKNYSNAFQGCLKLSKQNFPIDNKLILNLNKHIEVLTLNAKKSNDVYDYLVIIDTLLGYNGLNKSLDQYIVKTISNLRLDVKQFFSDPLNNYEVIPEGHYYTSEGEKRKINMFLVPYFNNDYSYEALYSILLKDLENESTEVEYVEASMIAGFFNWELCTEDQIEYIQAGGYNSLAEVTIINTPGLYKNFNPMFMISSDRIPQQKLEILLTKANEIKVANDSIISSNRNIAVSNGILEETSAFLLMPSVNLGLNTFSYDPDKVSSALGASQMHIGASMFFGINITPSDTKNLNAFGITLRGLGNIFFNPDEGEDDSEIYYKDFSVYSFEIEMSLYAKGMYLGIGMINYEYSYSYNYDNYWDGYTSEGRGNATAVSLSIGFAQKYLTMYLKTCFNDNEEGVYTTPFSNVTLGMIYNIPVGIGNYILTIF